MNISKLQIRSLEYEEIPLLKDFPPEEWHTDLSQLLFQHFGQPYFYPVVAEIENTIVGCGHGIINDTVGWLGNIIVLSEFRKQGIGLAITQHLVEYLQERGCTRQLLIATVLGEPIYRKLGFTTSLQYLFYQGKLSAQARPSQHIRQISKADFPALHELDQDISGEVRSQLIERFWTSGWAYEGDSTKMIQGVYLPDLGNGLILARDAEAGLELLKYKLGRGDTLVVIPSANTVARDFLTQQGFTQATAVPRMVLGQEVAWKPEAVFSRGSGYCG